jgi:hypothetical protein
MTAMHPYSAIPITDEERLGALAMQFRGTRRDSERQDIARESTRTVHRLIQGGHWYEMPSPEDQLPDDLDADGVLRLLAGTAGLPVAAWLREETGQKWDAARREDRSARQVVPSSSPRLPSP